MNEEMTNNHNESLGSSNGKESLNEKEKRIIKQTEYYFGDINLPRDKFLLAELKKDFGWIPLTTMLKFRRLAEITSDMDEIASALKKSDLLLVSDDGTRIRRHPDKTIPKNSMEHWNCIKEKTAYVKGFAEDTTLDEILNFFDSFGDVQNVHMRREKGSRKFKGSVFATFKDVDTVKAFINNDVNAYKDRHLVKMLQNNYWAIKQQENKDKKAAAKEAKLSKKCADDKLRKKNRTAPHFIRGLVLCVTNLPKKDVGIKKLKEFFGQYGNVAYVKYEDGDEKSEIRFNGEENGAATVWENAKNAGEDGKVLLDGNELSASVLSGEEEEKYWEDFGKKKVEKFNRKENFNNSRGRRGQKRPRDGLHIGAPNAKQRKVFDDNDD